MNAFVFLLMLSIIDFHLCELFRVSRYDIKNASYSNYLSKNEKPTFQEKRYNERNGNNKDEKGKGIFGSAKRLFVAKEKSNKGEKVSDCLNETCRRRSPADYSANGRITSVFPLLDRLKIVGQTPLPESGSAEPHGHANGILAKDWRRLLCDSVNAFLEKNFFKLQVEGRGRRREQRMLALIVMGFLIMATVLIPTGFQFLTVLGGKSLLLAKMALIMSAISGLKKIATSNIGYGFYHTGNDGHYNDHIQNGFHDKFYQANSQQNLRYALNR